MKIKYSELVKNWKYEQSIEESYATEIIKTNQNTLNHIHYWAFNQILSLTANTVKFKAFVPSLDEFIVATPLGKIKVIHLSFDQNIFCDAVFRDDLELGKKVDLFFNAYKMKQQAIFDREYEV